MMWAKYHFGGQCDPQSPGDATVASILACFSLLLFHASFLSLDGFNTIQTALPVLSDSPSLVCLSPGTFFHPTSATIPWPWLSP